MPELTQFCNYVRQHFNRQHFAKNSPADTGDEASDVEKELSWLFNGRQLIEMFSLFDLADVVSHLIQYQNLNIILSQNNKCWKTQDNDFGQK